MALAAVFSNLNGEYQDILIEELQGKSLAIDGQIWLYESWKESESGLSNNYLSGFHHRCKALLDLSIQPFIIFDQYQQITLPKITTGNDTARERSEFQFVRDARPIKVHEGARMRYGRNITKMKNIDKVTELLEAMGIRYFKSKAVDNEAAGSFLEDQEKVMGFVSPDPTYFMYGGKHLFSIDFDSSFKVVSIRKLSAELVMQKTGLTRGRLIALAMLLGCDYFPKKMTGVGVVTALEIVSAFSLHEDDHPCAILDRFRNFCDPTFNGRAEETPPRAKLRQGCFNFDDFNPSSDQFGEAVDAYMWSNLEDLPYEMDKVTQAYNQKKINDLINCALKMVEIDESVVLSKDQRKTRKRTIDDGDSSMDGSVSNGVKRRIPSMVSNGMRRSVVISCSRSEAIAWSKREWEAILALKKATTQHINSEVPSGRRSTAITVSQK
ncbi:hypothetical protein PFISCL1PPCAC_10444 [Pristionchus fissidentatus]|uniref:XPG-I domain-containing protein n=1 Tax=Pristionchus fissidentatus TaxID=1538716 RepID=A0AAV5VHG4_9BILA|nr:hypothetical protein PFISCL1PPCAC_10444 [Pristionchus fissidentatus]